MIHDTDILDAAEYTCVVANKIGRVESAGRLSVQVPPKIEVDSAYKNMKPIKGGTTATVRANIAGFPQPTVTWFHKDIPLPQTADFNVETGPTYSTLTISRMKGEYAGTYKVVAGNKYGSDSAEFVFEVKDKPGVPKNLRVIDQYKDFITIAWDAPVDSGGSAVTGYVIERREANRTTWSKLGDVGGATYQFKATKLNEGTEYFFRVAAENSIGVGPHAMMEEGVMAKLPFGVPGAPRKLQIEDLFKTSVTLTWEKPDFDGGSPVFGYYVERRQAYSTRWLRVNKAAMSSLMYTVRELTEDEEYEFRVVAENDAGLGKPSETTGVFKARDPFSKPGKPGKPEAVMEPDNSAELTWAAPRDDGNCPILNYIVEKKAVGDVRWNVVNDIDKIKETKYTVTGLESDVEYEFRVSAENKAGISEPSLTTSPVKYEEKIDFIRPLSDVKITKLPSTATFECEVTKSLLQANWFKDGQPIKQGPKYEIITELKTHKLTIRDCEEADEGSYTVSFKKYKSSAELKIKAPPTFVLVKMKDRIVLKEGESTAIEVPFFASPQPKVTWEFNKKPFIPSERHTLDTVQNMTSLCIGHAQVEDAGDYVLTLDNGHGRVSERVKIIVLGRPGPPCDLEVSNVTENSVTLSWIEPEYDGGSMVRRYIIEKRDTSRRTYTQVGTTESCEFKVTRLQDGGQYVFQVSAENDVGIGEPAELSQGVIAKSPFSAPSAPAPPTASNVFKDSLVLSWQPPDKDGGAPITGYHIERRSNTAKRWVFVTREPIRETKLDITSLFEGTHYEFRVSAENKAGTGSPSQPSNPVLTKDPWDPPGPPGIPVVDNVERRSVVLSWKPPKSDGGAELTGYVVDYCAEDAFKWERANDSPIETTRFKVTGLEENTLYKFRVAAQNKAGIGAFSECAMSVEVKEQIVGDAPKLVSKMDDITVIAPEVATLECRVKLGTKEDDIRWFKDAKEVYKGRKYDAFYWDNKATLIIKDTQPSDEATYRCEVSNPLGRIEASCHLSVHEIPKLDYDQRLKSTQLKAGSTLVLDVSFTGTPAPSIDWTVNGETLQLSNRHQVDKSTNRSTVTIKNINKNDAGNYKIVVTNKAGSANAQFSVNIKGVPPAPTNLEASDVTPESVTLSWNAPKEDGGRADVAAYVIEKRDASKTNWIQAGRVTGDKTNFVVPKLFEGNSYSFRVAAENSVGVGDYMEIEKAITPKLPYSEPEAPRNIKVSDVSRDGVTLSWAEPRGDGGASIEGYIVEKCSPGATRWIKVNKQPVKETELRVQDIIGGDELEFRVVAVNAAGYGKPSDATDLIKFKDPFDKPGTPGQPTIVDVAKDTATISWTAPRSDGGTPITNYRIEMRSVGTPRWDLVNTFEKVPGTSYVVKNLLEETDYEFRVSAENKAGISQPSSLSKSAKYVEPIEFTQPLKDVKVTKAGTTATFSCDVTKPNARVQWLKDGQQIYPDKKYDISSTGGNYRLTVNDVDDRDVGEYTIVVKGHTSTGKLQVEAKPQFTNADLYSEPLVLKAGGSAVIELPFTGAPQPKVSWKFNGQPLINSRRFHADTIHNMTSAQISRAECMDAGTYSVTLDNSSGSATARIEVVVLDKPGPPRELGISDVKEAGLTLTWKPPKSDGGSLVTGYVVEKREALRMTWQAVASVPDTQCDVSRLAEGMQYVFRVAAENKLGVGEFTELSRAIAAKSPHDRPSAPLTVRASDILHDSCILSWQPPPIDGGTPITGYHIERRTAQSARWTRINPTSIRDNSYPICDLVDGNMYEFRVIAENRVGLGEPSSSTPSVLAKDPWEKPGKPGLLEISDVSKRSCRLSWKAPPSDGGDVIRNYSVEYKPVDAFKWTKANQGERTAEPTYKITGLETDLEYEFRVAAENRAGLGPYSEVTMPVKTKVIEVGNAPTILSHLSNVTASTGQTIKLECDIDMGKPKAEIRWYKDAREVYKSQKYRQAYNEDEQLVTLTVHDIGNMDGGKYRCEAYNQHGRVDTSCNVTILVTPKVEFDKRFSGVQEVKAGSTLMLPVNFSGLPAPRVTWMKDGMVLSRKPGHVQIDTGDNYSTMTVMGKKKKVPTATLR